MSRNMEELAPFVSTTQLLASYFHTKGYPGTLYTRSVQLSHAKYIQKLMYVAVKMDDYQIRRKIITRLP